MKKDNFNSGKYHEVIANIKRYEEMERNGKEYFFDIADYEGMINHYDEKEDFDAAIQVAVHAGGQHPYKNDFVIKQAELFIEIGRLNKAIEILEYFEVIMPSDVTIILTKCKALIKFKRYEEAITCLEDALKIGNNKGEIYFDLGGVYKRIDEYDKAISCFRCCLKENHENDEALFELARCHELKGDHDPSIKLYTAFIDRQPYTWEAWFNLGNVYCSVNRYHSAIEAYDFASLINEEFADAYFNRGNALYELGFYMEALKDYHHCTQLEESRATFYYIGKCFEKLGRVDEASVYYKKAA